MFQPKLNKKQYLIVVVGFVVMAAMAKFPPWFYHEAFQATPPSGFCWPICLPPSANSDAVSVDYTRLIIQWVVVGVVTGVMLYLARDSRGTV